MPFTVHVDSAYVGFIFLIVTEVFLVRVISSAQIRSFERDVKHRLDKGGEAQLGLKEFGPLRVLGGTRLKTALFLALPAAALLLLVALGELGISGRTIPTHAVTDTFTAGGYYSIRKSSFQQRAPNQFQGKWPSCVDYGNDRVVGHAATIPFEILDDGSLELKDAQCSSEDDIVISSFSTFCDSNVYYNTTSTGKVVYETSSGFLGFLMNLLSVFQLELGEYVFDPDRFYDTSDCPFLQNAEPDRYFWVNHEGDTKYNHSCAILDASSLIESTHSEVWIVDSLISGEDEDTLVNSNVVIECEVGCFEAIVEWCLSDFAVYTIFGSSFYLSIWYEGLDFSVDSSAVGIPSNDTPPRCATEDDNFWVETPLVGVGDCSSALSSMPFVDGGEENVTVISAWAVVVVTIAGVFTIVYHFVHAKGGYDLLSYEGVSKLYFKDINPESEWLVGGPLQVSKDGSIIRASRTNT